MIAAAVLFGLWQHSVLAGFFMFSACAVLNTFQQED